MIKIQATIEDQPVPGLFVVSAWAQDEAEFVGEKREYTLWAKSENDAAFEGINRLNKELEAIRAERKKQCP